MTEPKGDRLVVNLGAAQARKRLKGFGHGVRKVQTGGTGKSVIIHTAKGSNLQALKNQFADVGYSSPGEATEGFDAGGSSTTFSVGDIIVDDDRPEWGTGNVVEDLTKPRSPTAGQLLTIDFEHRGLVMVFTSQWVLKKIGQRS